MIFQPEALLKLADELALRPDEASLRSAASRAYYAVFLIGRAIANIHSRSPDVHAKTQDHFHQIGCKSIADLLGELRQRRNAADYRVHRRFTREQAFVALADAHEAHRALQSLPATPRPARP